MKLHAMTLKNFRSYRSATRITFENLTAIIGQNDAGKSSILEALDIFLDGGTVTLDQNDASKPFDKNEAEIEIICEFSDVDPNVDLDGGAKTSLADEALLNENEHLEIRKTYDCSNKKVKETIQIACNHFTSGELSKLLTLKQSDLKKLADAMNIPKSEYNASINHEIRAAIRRHAKDKSRGKILLDVTQGDIKDIWPKLEAILPSYFLYRSDRPSLDSDEEVQDPMKAAVTIALSEVSSELSSIKQKVNERLAQISGSTIERLKKFSPDIASALIPSFADPNWNTAFKVTLADQDGIPINKRGSGVRRLVLLSFFQAEADRNIHAKEKNARSIIYAIEEPETSQHPSNQIKLIDLLLDLSTQPDAQVIFTTHVPALAAKTPKNAVRYVRKDATTSSVEQGDEILGEVAESLGLLPDFTKKLTADVKVAVCVEGPTDVEFLTTVSAILNHEDPTIPSIEGLKNVVVLPLGGSTLKDWVNRDYLSKFGLTEVHIYDLDDPANPPYAAEAQKINQRGGTNKAFVTQKRELENYVHPRVIKEALEVDIPIDPMIDVPALCAQKIHEAVVGSAPWNELSDKKRKQKESKAKRRIANECFRRLSKNDIDQMDTAEEIKTWLLHISSAIQP